MADFNLGQLIWKVTANTSDFDKRMGNTDKSIGKTSKSFITAGKVITTAFVAALGVGGKKLIQLGSDAEETRNKFNVVFKDVSDEANKMARNLSDDFGLSSRASQELLSDTGDLLTGFGFTGKSALELSGEVNKLAVDLASFTNFSGGAQGASQALTKALLGERESVKSLGISILETDVKEQVAINTRNGLTFASERQAKAYATLQIAQRQSQNAIGDFERSEKSFANQTRIASANVEDQAVILADTLLPFANLAVIAFNDLSDSSEGVVQSFSDWIKSAEGAAAIGEAIGTSFGVVRLVFDALKEALDAGIESFGSLDDELETLSNALGDIESDFNAFDVVMATAIATGKILGTTITEIAQFIINLTSTIIDGGQVIGAFFKGLKDREFGDFKAALADYETTALNLVTGVKDGIVEVGTAIGASVAEAIVNIETAGDSAEASFVSLVDNVKESVVEAITETGKLGDQLKEVIPEATEEVIDELNELSPGGLFAALMGDTEGLTKESIEQLEAFKDAAGDIYGQIEKITGLYFDNELAELDASNAEKQNQIDAELESNLAALQQQNLTDEEYALKKSELEAQAAVKKENLEKATARKKYELEVKQFKAEQAFDIVSAIANTALAVTNALTAGPILGPILAGIIGGLGAIEVGLIATQSPPPRPSFANGGIVPSIPGVPATGDNTLINANPGELILNAAQQDNLVSQLGGGMIHLTVQVVGETAGEIKKEIYDGIFDASRRGIVRVKSKAVIT